jgi:hypothetical protein
MVASWPTMKAKMEKFGVRNLKELIRAEELEFARNPPPQGKKSGPGNNDEAPLWDAEIMLYRLDQGDDPRAMALHFVAEEIRYHTKESRFTWARGRGRQQDKFRFYRRLDYDSLLSAIWDLFAATAFGFPFLGMRVLRYCALAWLTFLPPMTRVRQHWYFYQRTAIRSRTIISFTVHRPRGSASASPEA